jgi:predicted nucleotidyltransferase
MTRLDDYAGERTRLLDSILSVLEGASAVKAVWLFGSLGRGEQDALSDIDIWVVMEDARIQDLVNHPTNFISQFGRPLLRLEAPQNAPLGGVYRMACYDAPAGPHIIDWYWQPASLAFIPADVKVLFDRILLPVIDQPVEFAGRSAINRALADLPGHFTSFFWMMWMITAKNAYRYPFEEEMELIPYVVEPICRTRKYLGLPEDLHLRSIPPHPSFDAKFDLLASLADQMVPLMQALSRRGETVPSEVIPAAYRYLEMLRSVHAIGRPFDRP